MRKCPLCGKWFTGEKEGHVCPPPLGPRPCPICGKVFMPLKSSQICCSTACGKRREKKECSERVRKFREKAKETGEVRVCPVCGEKFTPRRPNQLVCEKKTCRAEYKKRYDAARYRGTFTPATEYGTFRMPDPYQGKMLYFDGLHRIRGSMPGRAADPVLGF